MISSVGPVAYTAFISKGSVADVDFGVLPVKNFVRHARAAASWRSVSRASASFKSTR